MSSNKGKLGILEVLIAAVLSALIGWWLKETWLKDTSAGRLVTELVPPILQVILIPAILFLGWIIPRLLMGMLMAFYWLGTYITISTIVIGAIAWKLNWSIPQILIVSVLGGIIVSIIGSVAWYIIVLLRFGRASSLGRAQWDSYFESIGVPADEMRTSNGKPRQ